MGIDDLLLIIFLLSIPAIVAGMIKPTWVVRFGEKRTRKRVLLIYGLVMVISFVGFGAFFDPPNSTKENIMVSLEGENQQIYNQNAEAEESLDVLVKKIVISSLGEKTNMKRDRIIELSVEDYFENKDDKTLLITLAADENLTNNLMKRSILNNSKKLFSKIYEIKNIEDVNLVWKFDLKDAYGNEKESDVLKVGIEKITAAKINWENFEVDNFKNIADFYWEHPAFNN